MIRAFKSGMKKLSLTANLWPKPLTVSYTVRIVRELGCIFESFEPQNYNIEDMKGKLINQLSPVEDILGYKFKNKNFLLEAFSHSSFTEANNTGNNYEILELVGDAVLDYVVNSNLIKFTMFERYNIKERQ